MRFLLSLGVALNLVLWSFLGGMHVAEQQAAPEYEPPIIGHIVETEKGVEAVCYIYDDRIFLGCENQ